MILFCMCAGRRVAADARRGVGVVAAGGVAARLTVRRQSEESSEFRVTGNMSSLKTAESQIFDSFAVSCVLRIRYKVVSVCFFTHGAYVEYIMMLLLCYFEFFRNMNKTSKAMFHGTNPDKILKNAIILFLKVLSMSYVIFFLCMCLFCVARPLCDHDGVRARPRGDRVPVAEARRRGHRLRHGMPSRHHTSFTDQSIFDVSVTYTVGPCLFLTAHTPARRRHLKIQVLSIVYVFTWLR